MTNIQADCNTCSGEYDTEGDSISIVIGVCTKVYCGESSYDSLYLDALKESNTYEIDGDILILTYDDGNLIFY